MPKLLFFAAAREAAGSSSLQIQGTTVGESIDIASHQLPVEFLRILPSCGIWLNGEPADMSAPCSDGDELALIPPVSGG
ncbi:MAG: MoaD/ThiS family protein [Acidimicrobiaceae bacterium]|nr:MoaD/ThiS family protein [Acidimicrobiaceae bacterium]